MRIRKQEHHQPLENNYRQWKIAYREYKDSLAMSGEDSEQTKELREECEERSIRHSRLLMIYGDF